MKVHSGGFCHCSISNYKSFKGALSGLGFVHMSTLPAEAKGGGVLDPLKLELQVLVSTSKYVPKTKHRPLCPSLQSHNLHIFIVELAILILSN